MPRYKESLHEHLKNLDDGVDKVMTVLEVAFQLIEIFEIVHQSNRTFNDLKPENIMINRKTASS